MKPNTSKNSSDSVLVTYKLNRLAEDVDEFISVIEKLKHLAHGDDFDKNFQNMVEISMKITTSIPTGLLPSTFNAVEEVRESMEKLNSNFYAERADTTWIGKTLKGMRSAKK